MNGALIAGFLLFLAGALALLAQLWFAPLEHAVFVKLMITDGVALLILAVAYFVIREKRANDRLNSPKKLG